MSTSIPKPATTYPIVIGKILQYLRNQRQIDQGALARAVGVTQSTWSRVETGQSALTVDHLARAATVLKQKPEQILALVDQSVENLERQGIAVEYKRPSEKLDTGLVLIAGAALALLLAAILTKSK